MLQTKLWLNAAFELAAKQQYAAAVDNERRAPARTIPSFKSGDFLYVWARSSREQHVKKPDGKTTTLKKKKMGEPVGWTVRRHWRRSRVDQGKPTSRIDQGNFDW